MTTHGESRWTSLETKSSTAFLVGGLLWVLDTMLLGIELFAGVSILGTPGPVNPILYVSGTIVACIGLLGFYPELADRAPWTARVSAGVVAIAGTALSLLLVWFITANILNQPDPPGALLVLSMLGVALSFVLFGVAGVWTGVPSRMIGFLLLGVVATIIGGIVLVYVIFGGNSPDWTSPAIGAGVSVILLMVSSLLRSDPLRTSHEDPASDSAAR